jgi:hypothetical protein
MKRDGGHDITYHPPMTASFLCCAKGLVARTGLTDLSKLAWLA